MENTNKEDGKFQDNTQCNIDSKGIGLRAGIGFAGLAMSIFQIYQIFWQGADKLTIFIPLFITSIGFVQAKEKYCIAFGIMDILKAGKPELLVPQIKNIAKITLISLIISAVLTGLIYLI